jgi:hypothetical protein
VYQQGIIKMIAPKNAQKNEPKTNPNEPNFAKPSEAGSFIALAKKDGEGGRTQSKASGPWS